MLPNQVRSGVILLAASCRLHVLLLQLPVMRAVGYIVRLKVSSKVLPTVTPAPPMINKPL